MKFLGLFVLFVFAMAIAAPSVKSEGAVAVAAVQPVEAAKVVTTVQAQTTPTTLLLASSGASLTPFRFF